MCADYWLSQWRVWTGSNLSHRFQTGDYYENTYPRSDSLLTDVHCSYSATLLRPDRRAYTVRLQQMGANVVANGSGPINLTALTFQGSVSTNGVGVLPLFGIIFTGPTGSVNVSQYAGFTGPTSFGSGGPLNANTGSGDFVGMRGGLGNLFVPQGYVSGAALSDSITFNNATL